MRSPLAWLAVFLSLGIWISSFIRIPVLFIIVCAALFILISLITIRRSLAIVFLSVTFFFIGSLLYQIGQIHPPDHIKNFTQKETREAYLKGFIVNEPRSGKTSYGEPKSSFMVEADGLQMEGVKRQVSGRVKVAITGDAGSAADLNYGDRILLKGLLSRPRQAGNPGEFDYSRYLGRNGIFSLFSAKAEDAVILQEGTGNPVVRAAHKVRNRTRALIMSYLPAENANFLIAILLGLRQDVGDELSDVFMKTGTVHILAGL